MPYGVRVLYQSDPDVAAVDISDKVRSFTIRKSLEQYCDELDIEVVDLDFYDALSFAALPEAPQLQIYTKTGASWVSQGEFYIERPSINTDLNSVVSSFWGRSTTARLSQPFAPKVTKVWEEKTTFFAICDEMCTLVGLTWANAYAEVGNFVVFPYTYEAEQADPIEVITELTELAYGDSAYVTTDTAGHVCIKARQLIPTGATQTITDPISISMAEEPEWPDFGNRIKITASGSVSGYNIDLEIPQQCMDYSSGRVLVYARITDPDDVPLSDQVVTWSAEHGYVTFAANSVNTGTHVIYDEIVRADSFYEITVKFPPEAVRGVYSYNDYNKVTALGGVYGVSGNKITLTSALTFCDQMVRVDYEVAGLAVNYIIPGDVRGTDHVSARIGTDGDVSSMDVYIDNPCQCPPTISIRANPSSIREGESSRLLIYVENGGSPESRPLPVYLTVDTNPPHGGLDWTQELLTRVTIINEESNVQNTVAGVSQCVSNMYIYSVTGVYTYTKDVDTDVVTHTSGNLYSSFVGKVITLNTQLASETEVVIDYVCQGAVVCYYDGLMPGTDRLRTWIKSAREEPVEASCSISVSAYNEDPTDPDDPPPNCCDPGMCDADGEPCPSGSAYGEHRSYRTMGCYEEVWLSECEDNQTGLLTTKVKCYKDGELGCFEFSECDTNTKQEIECAPDTQCCENKLTNLRGCWPESECAQNVTPPNPKHRKKDESDDKEGPDCKTASGMTKCQKDQTCCEKNGVKGCYSPKDCGGAKPPDDQCYTKDCVSKGMTDSCLTSRFTEAIQTQSAYGCSCYELCDKEFDKYGLTQDSMKADPRALGDRIVQDHGYAVGSNQFWEQYETEKEQMMADCTSQCGDCAFAETITVSGPDEVTKPGMYQYEASGGVGGFSWSVSGMGATMNESQPGVVNLDDTACGSYTVVVQDACGNQGIIDARVTNNGHWVTTGGDGNCAFATVGAEGCPCGTEGENISGKSKIEYYACEELVDTAGFENYECENWCTPTFIRFYAEVGGVTYNFYKGWESIYTSEWRCY